MIGGAKKIELTPETIFQRLTPYDIFRIYCPEKNWKVNQAFHSPFRTDTHPSFMIGNRSGNLLFVDFADNLRRGDCFTFVKMIEGLKDINEVLKRIDKDFGLGLSGDQTNTAAYKFIKSEYEQPEELGKRYSHIQVITRPFTKEELAYWNEFHQNIDDLRENNVFSVKKVFMNKQLFQLNDSDLRFGYYYDGHWKIYRPHVKDRRRKWTPSNVPFSTIEGKLNLNPNSFVFINKSKKDYMVVKKLIQSTCAIQSESIGCFTKENVEFLRENSNRQILSFDSDIAGVTSSQQITSLLGFDYINVPREYLKDDIKDWAELARQKGMTTLERIFKEKGLL